MTKASNKPKVKYDALRGQNFCPCQFYRVMIIMKDGKEYIGIRSAPDSRALRQAIQGWIDKWRESYNISDWSGQTTE